jgi:small-conductance mechanosensitive channel
MKILSTHSFKIGDFVRTKNISGYTFDKNGFEVRGVVAELGLHDDIIKIKMTKINPPRQYLSGNGFIKALRVFNKIRPPNA